MGEREESDNNTKEKTLLPIFNTAHIVVNSVNATHEEKSKIFTGTLKQPLYGPNLTSEHTANSQLE